MESPDAIVQKDREKHEIVWNVEMLSSFKWRYDQFHLFSLS